MRSAASRRRLLCFNATDQPPDLPGLPGVITKAAHNFRKATSIFPPLGVGIGAGIGFGCGFGWPMTKAYGPPRALCGPAIAVGIGVGYGQGVGKRFGRDIRPQGVLKWVKSLEHTLDDFAKRILRVFNRKPASVSPSSTLQPLENKQ